MSVWHSIFVANAGGRSKIRDTSLVITDMTILPAVRHSRDLITAVRAPKGQKSGQLRPEVRLAWAERHPAMYLDRVARVALSNTWQPTPRCRLRQPEQRQMVVVLPARLGTR